MTRIFFTLAVLATALFLTALGFGLSLGDLKTELLMRRPLAEQLAPLEAEPAPSADSRQKMAQLRSELDRVATLQRRAGHHRLLGVSAALAVVFVSSLAITYFIGTSRWCREVADAYKLDARHTLQSAALKRSAVLWGMLGVGAVLVVSAAGAAADPATGRPGTESWAMPHLALAAVGGLLIARAFFAQWSAISENHQLIRTITAEVRRIRQERGLDG